MTNTNSDWLDELLSGAVVDNADVDFPCTDNDQDTQNGGHVYQDEMEKLALRLTEIRTEVAMVTEKSDTDKNANSAASSLVPAVPDNMQITKFGNENMEDACVSSGARPKRNWREEFAPNLLQKIYNMKNSNAKFPAFTQVQRFAAPRKYNGKFVNALFRENVDEIGEELDEDEEEEKEEILKKRFRFWQPVVANDNSTNVAVVAAKDSDKASPANEIDTVSPSNSADKVSTVNESDTASPGNKTDTASPVNKIDKFSPANSADKASPVNNTDNVSPANYYNATSKSDEFDLPGSQNYQRTSSYSPKITFSRPLMKIFSKTYVRRCTFCRLPIAEDYAQVHERSCSSNPAVKESEFISASKTRLSNPYGEEQPSRFFVEGIGNDLIEIPCEFCECLVYARDLYFHQVNKNSFFIFGFEKKQRKSLTKLVTHTCKSSATSRLDNVLFSRLFVVLLVTRLLFIFVLK